MPTDGFIFDYTKCVGCHACIIACYVENQTKPPIAWRQINSFNSKKIPLAGFLNLSIACNHCVEAPCLKACPAKAYIKDDQTGAIIHQPEKCIGCRYCTWACPFDAPKYNRDKGVVEKCHLCNHLVSKGIKPACANQCPTGALSFGSLDSFQHSDPVGIPITNFQPRIRTVRANIFEAIPQLDIRITGFDRNDKDSTLNESDKKIHAKEEWPLVFFTLIFAFLSGWIFSFRTDDNLPFKVIFIALCLLGILLSTFHLGKPFRASRSILNLKTSWLSREILLCGLFVFSVVLYFFLFQSNYMLVITSLISLMLLISIEMVYSIPKKSYRTPLHSSSTVLTALMFAFLFCGLWKLLVAVIAIKALLYIIRKGDSEIVLSPLKMLITSFRTLIGLIFPIGIVCFTKHESSISLLLCLLSGEIIDRFEFYSDIYIDTPSRILEQTLRDLAIKHFE